MLQDIRYGLRTLRQNPGFTAVVILTLALGIGMNTAVFSVVNAALFRPLTYPEADLLVWLANFDFLYEHRDIYVARPTYLRWREQAHAFESMTAYGNQDLALIADGQASQERIASIAGDFWQMAGAKAAFGRLFDQRDSHVMVLSNALFKRRFGGDPGIIGKTVVMNGYWFTITGVLAADFRFVFPQQYVSGDEVRDIDAYTPFPDPIMRLPHIATAQWDEAARAFGPAAYHVRVVAKLKPGVSMEQARAEMETVYARAALEYPSYARKFMRLYFAPLKDKLVGNARPALFVLAGGVGFVLLIACANIANLLLTHATTRNREIAIRTALGAGGVRVLRQLLTESVVLALIGGAAGLFLARSAITLMVRLASEAVPRLAEAAIDAQALGFTLAISLATGVLFGLGPALTMWRADVNSILKSDTGIVSASAGRVRIRGLLVVVEVALAIVLLSGAGLLLKSFWRMNANPAGFNPESILVMRVPLSGPQYGTWPPKAAYINDLLQRVAAAPGVEWAGIETTTFNVSVKVGDSSDTAAVRMVSPGYLRVIGVPLVKGRWPTDRESLDAVMVNESFARKIMRGRDPTGLPITGSFLSGTITGVVADFRHRQLDAAAVPEVYYPYERSPTTRSVKVLVRTSGYAMAVASTIRKLVSEIDPTQPVYELQTLEQALSDSIAPRRFNMFLLGTFAATALLMALVGIYGVIAYSVAQRTHEIGIRMALGAERSDIVRMVIRHGMGVALTGIVIGLAAAFGLTRLMSSLLYDVKPNDPQVFAAVALTLAVTAAFACWLPALKAALVDPVVALRYQ